MGDPASGAKSTNGSIEQGVIQPRTLPCLHACPPGRKSLQVTEYIHNLLPTPFESQSPQPRLPLAPENPPGSARICMHARSHERRGPRKTTRLHSMHVIPASCMNQPFFFSLLPFYKITKGKLFPGAARRLLHSPIGRGIYALEGGRLATAE